MTELDVLNLDLYQLAYTGTGGSQKADNEVPEHFVITLQAVFEVFIISLADHVLQKRLLLHAHEGKFPLLLTDAFEIAVNCPQSQVDYFGLVALDEPYLVSSQVLLRDSIVLISELTHGEQVR